MLNKLNETTDTVNELKETIGFMSKFMLSLQSSFKEAIEPTFTEKQNDGIYYSEDEMREFIKKVDKFTKK